MPQPNPTRRNILKGIAAAIVAPAVIPSSALGADGAIAPSNRIAMGFIGVGGHGLSYNLATFLTHDDCQVVAVNDVFPARRQTAADAVNRNAGSAGCRQYADFRELIAAKDIDAVCISTPDHWHVPMSMMALEAGKHVMCEKPTLTIAEGRALVDLVEKRKAVYQVGLEDRSLVHYHKLAEIVRNGGIGRLQKIFVKLPAGETFAREEPAPIPPGLDWNLWLGPAPFHPYTPTRTGPQQWRNIRDYSGGKLADWGAHLLDTAQVANFSEDSGPVEVEGEGFVPPNSMTTMPVKYKVFYRYANGVEVHVESGGVALRFEGSEGWCGNNGWRGRLEAGDEAILRRTWPAETSRIWPRPPLEHRNFLDCIRSRKPTTYTAEAGHRLSTVMHIANISIELGRRLRWDPQTESFPGDSAADALRSREARDWARG
jgi:myo-inositol 2-dehydrogenase / D-chiro-inositol 1-dehydrogenase